MDSKIASLLIEQLNDAEWVLMNYDATHLNNPDNELYRLAGVCDGLEHLLKVCGYKYNCGLQYMNVYETHPISKKPVRLWVLIRNGKEA